MNKIKNLKNCPHIVNLEKLDLRTDISGKVNKKIKQEILDRLNGLDTYRMVYKAGKNKVVGFILIPKKGKNIPCVIRLRGGSREFGKITNEALVHRYTHLASNGYVVITTQYPGVDGGDGKDDWGGPETIDSILVLKKILNWVPKANPKLIGVAGHSRGGLMVYMLLRKFRWIQAAVVGGATTDEFRASKERDGWRKHQISLFGKAQNELLKRSPIKWVKEFSKKCPILIVHGSSDWRVPADHSILISKELYDSKVPYKFILYEGADHGISEFRKEYRDQTLDWFNKYLIENRELPNMKPHGL